MKKTLLGLITFMLLGLTSSILTADSKTIQLYEDENFWGGCVTDGRAMPFGDRPFERDLYGDTKGNQAQPLLISARGRYVWCGEPFKFTFEDKKLFRS